MGLVLVRESGSVLQDEPYLGQQQSGAGIR